jgi:heme exporter protein D
MMPELGRHAVAVLGSYGATLVLLGGLVLVTWLRSRAVRRRLDAAEARRRG